MYHPLKLSCLFTALFTVGVGATESGDDAAMTHEIDGQLPYEVFENSVDHVDLATCPDDLDEAQYFCRMTLAAEQANVFVFSTGDAQPLVMVKHYLLEGDGLPF